MVGALAFAVLPAPHLPPIEVAGGTDGDSDALASAGRGVAADPDASSGEAAPHSSHLPVAPEVDPFTSAPSHPEVHSLRELLRLAREDAVATSAPVPPVRHAPSASASATVAAAADDTADELAALDCRHHLGLVAGFENGHVYGLTSPALSCLGDVAGITRGSGMEGAAPLEAVAAALRGAAGGRAAAELAGSAAASDGGAVVVFDGALTTAPILALALVPQPRDELGSGPVSAIDNRWRLQGVAGCASRSILHFCADAMAGTCWLLHAVPMAAPGIAVAVAVQWPADQTGGGHSGGVVAAGWDGALHVVRLWRDRAGEGLRHTVAATHAEASVHALACLPRPGDPADGRSGDTSSSLTVAGVSGGSLLLMHVV
jgi:hypothetical protein